MHWDIFDLVYDCLLLGIILTYQTRLTDMKVEVLEIALHVE